MQTWCNFKHKFDTIQTLAHSSYDDANMMWCKTLDVIFQSLHVLQSCDKALIWCQCFLAWKKQAPVLLRNTTTSCGDILCKEGHSESERERGRERGANHNKMPLQLLCQYRQTWGPPAASNMQWWWFPPPHFRIKQLQALLLLLQTPWKISGLKYPHRETQRPRETEGDGETERGERALGP